MSKKGRIVYYLSEEGQKKSLLQGGDGKRQQELETDLTEEFVSLADVDPDGNAILQIGEWNRDSERNATPERIRITEDICTGPRITGTAGFHCITFDEPQTAEALIRFEQERREAVERRMKELQPQLAEAVAEWEEKKRKEEEARKKKEEERKRRVEEERARLQNEKEGWIEQHGSNYLKRAVKLGYDCQRQYVIERAQAEFPDFELDFDEQARWKTRVCPSQEALEEVEDLLEKGCEAQVVWLTAPPETRNHDEAKTEDFVDQYYDYEEFQPREAIIIREYLGKYDLVKILEQ